MKMNRSIQIVALIAVLSCVAGCTFKGNAVDPSGSMTSTASGEPVWQLQAVTMRVYPSSRFRIDSGQAILDARIELRDGMEDPVKSVGKFQFNLYEGGKPNQPSTDKKLYAWQVPLLTLTDQRRHWDAITRTYTFRLKLDAPIDPEHYTSLVVWFTANDGRRLETSAVLTVVNE